MTLMPTQTALYDRDLFFVAIFKTCERIDQKMYEGYKIVCIIGRDIYL